MMGFYRNKQKPSSCHWKYQYEGVHHTGTFKAESDEEATAKFFAIKQKIERGETVVTRQLSSPEEKKLFSTFVDEFIKTNKITENGHIYAAIKEFFAGQFLPEIERSHCVAFRQSRLNVQCLPRKEGGKVWDRSPRTVNKEYSVLSAIFRTAVEKFLIKSNPCHDVPALKFAKKIPTVWTREQAAHAVSFMIGEREHMFPIAMLDMQVALSRKDLLRLTVGQVIFDGDGGYIRKRRAKTGVILSLPLNSVAVAILRPLTYGKRSRDFVFINPATGKPYTNLRRSLETVCRLAKLPRLTWHGFRHCVGTWMAEDGNSLPEIAGMLGHSDYRTSAIYVHLAAKSIQAKAETMGRWAQRFINNQAPEPDPERQISVKSGGAKLRLVS